MYTNPRQRLDAIFRRTETVPNHLSNQPMTGRYVHSTDGWYHKCPTVENILHVQKMNLKSHVDINIICRSVVVVGFKCIMGSVFPKIQLFCIIKDGLSLKNITYIYICTSLESIDRQLNSVLYNYILKSSKIIFNGLVLKLKDVSTCRQFESK